MTKTYETSDHYVSPGYSIINMPKLYLLITHIESFTLPNIKKFI